MYNIITLCIAGIAKRSNAPGLRPGLLWRQGFESLSLRICLLELVLFFYKSQILDIIILQGNNMDYEIESLYSGNICMNPDDSVDPEA